MLNLLYTATATAASLLAVPTVGDAPDPQEFTNQYSWEGTLQSSGWVFTPEESYADPGYYADLFDATKITIEYTRSPGQQAVFAFDDNAAALTLTAQSANAEDETLSDLTAVSIVDYGWGTRKRILYQVPSDASPGDVFYGSIKIDLFDATKYALVKVTVSPVIIPEQEEDFDDYISSLEDSETNFDLHYLPMPQSPTEMNGWKSQNYIFDKTDSLEISASVGTLYFFNAGYTDAEMDITPVVQDPAFEVTQYAFESLQEDQRDRDRYWNGLMLTGSDLEGKSFYISIKMAEESGRPAMFLSVKLTIERPSRFMNKVAWEKEITTGTYGNNMIIDINEDVREVLLQEDSGYAVVMEVPLAAGGILGLSVCGSQGPRDDPVEFYQLDSDLDPVEEEEFSAENIPLTELSSLHDQFGCYYSGRAYQVPEDAIIGDTYYVGVHYQGIEGSFKITVTAPFEPFETVTEFESALPSDATKKSITSLEGFSDSQYEAYKFEPTESLELSPGDVLAVMIDIEGVTATFKNPHTTVDHFGAFINKDRMALIEVSSVAKRDPAIYEYPVVPDDVPIDDTPDITEPDDDVPDDVPTEEETDEDNIEEEEEAGEEEAEEEEEEAGEEEAEAEAEEEAEEDEEEEAEAEEEEEEEAEEEAGEEEAEEAEEEAEDEDEDPADAGDEVETTDDTTDPITPDDTADEDAETTDDTTDNTTPVDTADEELTPEDPDEPAPVWSPLVAEANADIYPSFAWTVPTNAAIGSKFQLQIEVNKGSSSTLLKDNYYGVFQVTVTAPPPPPPVEEEPEDSASSLLITIAIVTAATAVSVACLYFFVI